MNQKNPVYVTDLETAYGTPNQAGLGSAVFYEPIVDDDSLAQMALDKYKYFVGDLWARYGEEAWMAPWKEVYARLSTAKANIVAELRAITDPYAALSAPMILDNIEGAQEARAALSAAYDDPERAAGLQSWGQCSDDGYPGCRPARNGRGDFSGLFAGLIMPSSGQIRIHLYTHR